MYKLFLRNEREDARYYLSTKKLHTSSGRRDSNGSFAKIEIALFTRNRVTFPRKFCFYVSLFLFTFLTSLTHLKHNVVTYDVCQYVPAFH